LNFLLNDRDLLLTGAADASDQGVIATSAGGTILAAPPNHRAPAFALARTLSPGDGVTAPAMALMNVLPLVQSPNSGDPKAPRGPTVRLRSPRNVEDKDRLRER
jgi:hypothetical protein